MQLGKTFCLKNLISWHSHLSLLALCGVLGHLYKNIITDGGLNKKSLLRCSWCVAEQFRQMIQTLSVAKWVMTLRIQTFLNKPNCGKGNISALYGKLLFSVNCWINENLARIFFWANSLGLCCLSIPTFLPFFLLLTYSLTHLLFSLR